jgi:hypothetical protein
LKQPLTQSAKILPFLLHILISLPHAVDRAPPLPSAPQWTTSHDRGETSTMQCARRDYQSTRRWTSEGAGRGGSARRGGWALSLTHSRTCPCIDNMTSLTWPNKGFARWCATHSHTPDWMCVLRLPPRRSLYSLSSSRNHGRCGSHGRRAGCVGGGGETYPTVHGTFPCDVTNCTQTASVWIAKTTWQSKNDYVRVDVEPRALRQTPCCGTESE